MEEPICSSHHAGIDMTLNLQRLVAHKIYGRNLLGIDKHRLPDLGFLTQRRIEASGNDEERRFDPIKSNL